MHCFLVFWWTSSQAHTKLVTETKQWHENCWKPVFLTFIIAFMLPEKIHKILFNLWKSRTNHEKHCFLLSFWWSSTQAHLKQIAKIKTPHQNCGKTVFLTFYNSIHVARNNSQDSFQCMENQGNTIKDTVFLYLMNFNSSSPKIDCRNKNTTSKLWENNRFNCYNSIHVAKNNS